MELKETELSTDALISGRRIWRRPWIFCTAIVISLWLSTVQMGICANLPRHNWPMFQYRATHNAVFSEPAWQNTWVADLGAHGNGGLAIVRNTVYVESFNHYVHAINAMTGKTIWSTQLPNVVMTTPIVTMGVVIVGSGTGEVQSSHENDTAMLAGRALGDGIYGLDAKSGRILWEFETKGEDMPSGIFAVVGTRPTFIFSNGGQHVYAVSPSSGRLIWKQRIPGGNFMTSLVLSNGVVYGSSGYTWDYFYQGWLHNSASMMANENHTWAINATDGSFVWANTFGQPTESPAVADGLLFTETIKEALPSPIASPFPTVQAMLAQQSNQVQVLDASTGHLIWSRNGAFAGGQTHVGSNIETAASLYVNRTLYQALPLSQEFSAFEAQTGRQLWNLRTDGPVKMSAIEKDGRLYFGDASGKLYVVDASRGTILQTRQFSGPFGASPCVIVGKTLFTLAGKSLYAIPIDGLNSKSTNL